MQSNHAIPSHHGLLKEFQRHANRVWSKMYLPNYIMYVVHGIVNSQWGVYYATVGMQSNLNSFVHIATFIKECETKKDYLYRRVFRRCFAPKSKEQIGK